MTETLDSLRRAIAQLRRELPEGAPIVPLATIRSRDRIEMTPGMLVPFGLASPIFFDHQYGEVAVLQNVLTHVFSGCLEHQHVQGLVPLCEAAIRARAPLAFVADDVDETVLALLAMNKSKGTMQCAAIVPHRIADEVPLAAFAALTTSYLGEATPAALSARDPGRVPRLLVTLHETVVAGPLPLLDPAARVGLVHVGGEDLAEARARAHAARQLLTNALN